MRRDQLIPAALAALLAGCAAGAGAPPPPPAPAPPPTSPALAAVAAAAPGPLGVVNDPVLGGDVRLDVLTAYTAASQRQCKRVAIRRLRDGALASRVACAGPSGWYWTAASLT